MKTRINFGRVYYTGLIMVGLILFGLSSYIIITKPMSLFALAICLCISHIGHDGHFRDGEGMAVVQRKDKENRVRNGSES